MNERILITGGSGLLGSYLIRWFLQKGYSNITATYHHSLEVIPADVRDGVTWLPLNLPDRQACIEITEGQDWVIHAAGYVSYRPADKYKLLDINQTGTELLVNACIDQNVSHFVYVGSIGALGRETNNLTLNEKSEWVENEWSTSYGLSKYLGELEVWRAAAEGLNVSVVLPSIILGSGDWNRSSLQMIKRIVSSPGYFPTGQTGFVDVRDVTTFIGMILEQSRIGERWLLNGSSTPYSEMYKSIARHLGLEKTFKPAPKWLANLMLRSSNLFKGNGIGLEVLKHTYGTFSFDATKSLEVENFSYRPLDESLRDIAAAYRQDQPGLPLPF
ncbi:MAG TPA: NAD-dependent epimerase/dehydratase family protein [Saprospiraceae bacterium]